MDVRMRSKVERLNVYLAPAHKRTVEKLAEEEGESVAAIVRRLIRQEGERQGLWPGIGRSQAKARAGKQEARKE